MCVIWLLFLCCLSFRAWLLSIVDKFYGKSYKPCHFGSFFIIFRKFLQLLVETIQKEPPGQFRDNSGTIPGQFRDNSGTIPGQFRDILGRTGLFFWELLKFGNKLLNLNDVVVIWMVLDVFVAFCIEFYTILTISESFSCDFNDCDTKTSKSHGCCKCLIKYCPKTKRAIVNTRLSSRMCMVRLIFPRARCRAVYKPFRRSIHMYIYIYIWTRLVALLADSWLCAKKEKARLKATSLLKHPKFQP
jgi:hypothetical protein